MSGVPTPAAGTARGRQRLLLVGDGLSAFGSWIDFLAILTLAAWQFQVTPTGMAAVSAAGLLPGMLAAPFIGRWCDRGHAQRLLLGSIAARAATTAALLVTGDLVVFVALVGLRSVFAAVAPPAIHVLAVRALAPAALPRFYALLNVLNNTAKVLAPGIGTVAASWLGEGAALVLSLGCSLGALAFFAALRLPGSAAAASTSSTQAAAQSGPAGAGDDRLHLRALLWLAATCAFFVFLVNNLLPLVLQRAGIDKAWLGLLVSASGLGNVLAGLWLARRAQQLQGHLSELQRPAWGQLAGFAAIGLLLWRTGEATAPLLAVVFFLVGTASARYAIALNVFMVTHFAARIGAVSGRLQAWQQAMIFVAPMVGALVLERWGAAALFGCAVGSAALSFGLLALHLRRSG